MRRMPATATFTLAVTLGCVAGLACTRSQPRAALEAVPTTVELTTTAPSRPPATADGGGRGPCPPAQCPVAVLPGYEVAGAPDGWAREVQLYDDQGYRIQYREPVASGDPIAVVEADGRRISLVVERDPSGTATIASGNPGDRAATVAGFPAVVSETAPAPHGRHEVTWRASGLRFSVYAYMDDAELLELAETVTATGRPVER